MRHLLILIWVALAAATPYRLTVYAPYAAIDGAILNAMANCMLTGISGPATYCPQEVQDQNACPDVAGTLVYSDMTSMAVGVPGGQFLYVAPDGQVKYTTPHSTYTPPGSYLGGWYNKTAVSECAAPMDIVDFLATDGSNIGGLMLCPDTPDFVMGTGASYQLYAKTPGFNQTNCEDAVGVKLEPSDASLGCWEYM